MYKLSKENIKQIEIIINEYAKYKTDINGKHYIKLLLPFDRSKTNCNEDLIIELK